MCADSPRGQDWDFAANVCNSQSTCPLCRDQSPPTRRTSKYTNIPQCLAYQRSLCILAQLLRKGKPNLCRSLYLLSKKLDGPCYILVLLNFFCHWFHQMLFQFSTVHSLMLLFPCSPRRLLGLAWTDVP